MSDRRLVVGEFDPGDANYGELFAITAANAAAVPLPAFQIKTTLPAAGTTVGEAVYDSSDGSTKVWDGAAWRAVVAPAVVNIVPITAAAYAALGLKDPQTLYLIKA